MAHPTSPDAAAADRPWRRPGAAGYALKRLRGFARSPVDVYAAQPTALVIDNDVAVPTRDGTILRANVYRPPGDGPFAALLCAHPYGKDNLPTKKRCGRGYSVSIQYRLLRQPTRPRFSDLTGWEAPDPVWWTEHGFAVVNCDLRGAGRSDGVCALLSDQEGEDVYDLVEWAAAQPWSTGAVGMIGVSYLAISQSKTAALRPPHLAAIVPWEGFTDAYRDFARTGGVRETGFLKMWSRGLRAARLKYTLNDEAAKRPLRDEWWQGLVPDLPKIEVPALICGSFSDNNLHSRGSVRAFEQISSPERHLCTHRGGKWATFYSPSALETQLAFLDRHLRGGTGAPQPRVRLEVREDATISSRSAKKPAGRRSRSTGRRSTSAVPDWAAAPPNEPAPSRSIPVPVAHDSAGRWTPTPKSPVRWRCGCSSKCTAATTWIFSLGPSATLFRAGEQLRLVVAGRWLWPRNPLTGQFPSAYERGPRGRCTIHWGPDYAARLLIPVIA